jgi:hypothetical protein
MRLTNTDPKEPGRGMKSVLWSSCLVLAAAVPASAQTKATQLIRQFGWHTNLEGARTTARQTGKPIFLVFRCDP